MSSFTLTRRFDARLVRLAFLVALMAVALFLAACAPGPGGRDSLTLYSGRTESLIGPLLERYKRDVGADIRVRYGDTAELAAAILEEGARSPADVLLAQDAGALGAVAQRGLFVRLPDTILNKVDPRFRSPEGLWVGISGRARVIVYNPSLVSEAELPDSVLGLTDIRWRGRIGWAPTNGSFQAFVTALRIANGEAGARSWLSGIKANEPRSYANNTAIVRAVASGEIHVGLVNHYYLYAIEKDQGPVAARNYHPRAGDAGSMINVAGAGILASSRNQEAARRFVDYLLSSSAQEYFTTETFEYPLIAGVAPPAGAPPLAQIRAPGMDLGSLADLDATLRLLRDTGVV